MLVRFKRDLPAWRRGVESVGLVPTMGNLHEGHMALVEASIRTHHRVVVSVFVNPKQFSVHEDFDRYPRTLEEDCAKLKDRFDGVVVYAPVAEEIYPPRFKTEISVPAMADVLCGKFRPGHFSGVCTVVYRLLGIVRPDAAYFGAKDYQQFKIVERMAGDLGLPVRIVRIPTQRDADGLALSSRNQYLTCRQRREALKLPKTLDEVSRLAQGTGVSAAKGRAGELCLKDSDFQYLEILDADNLREVGPSTNHLLVAGALFQGRTRLIDNKVVSLRSC